jgi:hypothetical protein
MVVYVSCIPPIYVFLMDYVPVMFVFICLCLFVTDFTNLQRKDVTMHCCVCRVITLYMLITYTGGVDGYVTRFFMYVAEQLYPKMCMAYLLHAVNNVLYL